MHACAVWVSWVCGRESGLLLSSVDVYLRRVTADISFGDDLSEPLSGTFPFSCVP